MKTVITRAAERNGYGRSWKIALVLTGTLLPALQTNLSTSALADNAAADAARPVKVTKIERYSAPAQTTTIVPAAISCHFDQQPTARGGEEIVRRIAKEEHSNVDLAVAIARQESGFRMDSVSIAGAVGLMQLMPATARRFGVDICNAEDNVRGGVRFLKLLEKKYANPLYVLAAYNAGEAAVEQNRGIPLYPETVRYVSAILTDLYGWQPFNDSTVSVETANSQRKTSSKKTDKDNPGTWSQGFVLHVE
jgi:soluble lytic murein transglycosylase-like protein